MKFLTLALLLTACGTPEIVHKKQPIGRAPSAWEYHWQRPNILKFDGTSWYNHAGKEWKVYWQCKAYFLSDTETECVTSENTSEILRRVVDHLYTRHDGQSLYLEITSEALGDYSTYATPYVAQ